MREIAPTDFYVDVEGIGTFSFGKRKMRDELRIAAEFSRLTEGVETPTAWLEIVAGWIAALTVLTVEAPAGWSLEDMDPLDQESYDKLRKVHEALRSKEHSFRKDKKPGVEAKREADSEGAGVLVPAEVQPGADGSTVS